MLSRKPLSNVNKLWLFLTNFNNFEYLIMEHLLGPQQDIYWYKILFTVHSYWCQFGSCWLNCRLVSVWVEKLRTWLQPLGPTTKTGWWLSWKPSSGSCLSTCAGVCGCVTIVSWVSLRLCPLSRLSPSSLGCRNSSQDTVTPHSNCNTTFSIGIK